MTLTEICLLTLTLTMIASAGALIAIVLHLRVSVRMLEGLIRDSRASVQRIDEVGVELQELLHRANHDYRAVSEVAGRVLGEVVQPARNAVAVIRGIRTGLGVLFRPGRRLTSSTLEARSNR